MVDTDGRPLILIADDDADIRRFVEINLRPEGFETVAASNGEEAVDVAFSRRPALILLDVMMPKLDGFEVCRRVRADFRTAGTPVIMLTARSMSADKVVGLTAGADDYIIKPFDPIELVARVQSTLRRSRVMRATSPLTGLPGNVSIEDEIARRATEGLPVAVCYADLDNFKAFNDRYGFMRGDQAIAMTADVIRDAAEALAPGSFVGHIGGDDFLLVCEPAQVEPLCRRILDEFAKGAVTLYDASDLAAGGVELQNRQGVSVRYPVLSISIGICVYAGGKPVEPRQLVDRATEMKALAKQTPGNIWATDRRAF